MAPTHLIDACEKLNLWQHLGNDIQKRKRCKKARHRIARPRGEVVYGQHKVGCKVDREEVEWNENLVMNSGRGCGDEGWSCGDPSVVAAVGVVNVSALNSVRR